MKEGERTQLASVNVKLDPKSWYEIEIRHVGNRIAAWTDVDRAHSLVCGEFDNSATAEELVAVGYSRRATKVSYAALR